MVKSYNSEVLTCTSFKSI